jgi:hypothetical protein
MRLIIVLLLLHVGFAAAAHAPEEGFTIRYLAPVAQEETLHNYFTELLKKALAKGADGRPIPRLEPLTFMEQGRLTHELIRGELVDINWMAADDTRTKNLRMIPIPLDRGLFGYRRFIIHKDKVAEFDRVQTLADLKHYVACQGLGWPDSTIMRAAGLKVREAPGLESIFKQIAAGRCDYFPRGFIEPESELLPRATTYPTLVIYDKLMLHYPYGIFFFVNRKNEALAQWIENGLNRMIDSGEFEKYMHSNPLTRPYFPLKRHPNILTLKNPLMVKGLDYQNTRYWFVDKDFQ